MPFMQEYTIRMLRVDGYENLGPLQAPSYGARITKIQSPGYLLGV